MLTPIVELKLDVMEMAREEVSRAVVKLADNLLCYLRNELTRFANRTEPKSLCFSGTYNNRAASYLGPELVSSDCKNLLQL